MSVKSRMDKYWTHDAEVGRKIVRETGFKKLIRMNPTEYNAAYSTHRLNGSMRKYHKLYRRLNSRGHCAPIIKAMMKKAAFWTDAVFGEGGAK